MIEVPTTFFQQSLNARFINKKFRFF